MSVPTIEDLKDGLASPFWAWFKAHMEAEWGRGGVRFHEAVRKAAAKDEVNGHQYLQMVIFAQAEIEALFIAPVAHLNHLRHQQQKSVQEPGPSRRGPGL